MTDHRALCARMADELDRYRQLLMDDRRETHALAAEARAALAEPEPEGPTDEELIDMAEFYIEDNGLLGLHNAGEFARAVLARYGRPAIEPDGPAVPDGREPASVVPEPTDKELCKTYVAAYYAAKDRQGPVAQAAGLRAVLNKWGVQ